MIPSNHRRRFLEQSMIGGAGLAVASRLPHSWLHAAADAAKAQERILVVIQLSGGNDGLNTVVPYRDTAYYRARPKLAIAADDLFKLNDEMGLHPSLRALEAAFSDDRMSIVQGVGYPQPNRSHFESMDLWHTCERKQNRAGQGWLGRFIGLQTPAAGTGDALGLHLGQEQLPLALVGRSANVPSISSLKQFRLQLGDREALKQELFRLTQTATQESKPADQEELLSFIQTSSQTAIEASRKLEKAAAGDASGRGEFPESPLGEKLHIVSQLILGDFPTRIYYLSLDGFDTHAQQPAAHASLLKQWSQALAAFLKCLKDRGALDRVLVMSFSEFGRRLAENASDGTDHGAAAPLFLAGPKIQGPLFGKQPSLSDLDDGDVKYHTDFRSVYATILEKWFHQPSRPILGETFSTLELLND